MFKSGDKIKIPEQTITLKDDYWVFDINHILYALGAVKVKTFNNESYIQNEFNNLSLERQLLIMDRALDRMHSNQYLTKWMAIYLAMGYKNDEGKEDTWYKVGEE
jgi:hypothetical protein